MSKLINYNLIFAFIVFSLFACSQDTIPSTEAELHSALKSANPSYTGTAKVYKDEDGIIWGIDVSNCNVSTLKPIRGMKLKAVACSRNEIKDISPLIGMELEQFSCSQTLLKDLSPLTGMPLWTIDVTATKVTDLTPLKGMPLQMIGFDPSSITKGIEVLKDMKSLSGIWTEPDKDAGKETHFRVGLTTNKFWEIYNKGEFKNNK